MLEIVFIKNIKFACLLPFIEQHEGLQFQFWTDNLHSFSVIQKNMLLSNIDAYNVSNALLSHFVLYYPFRYIYRLQLLDGEF